jgi:hypothetical protein
MEHRVDADGTEDMTTTGTNRDSDALGTWNSGYLV